MLEYLDLIRSHTSPLRMVKGHAFKMLGVPYALGSPDLCKCMHTAAHSS